jgi:hypothetical protein
MDDRGNKMKYAKLVLFAAISLTAGCVSMIPKDPIKGDMAHGEFGSYPNDYDSLIKAWGQSNLKDPDSAKYVHISKPRKEWAVAESMPIYGWSVCADINSKNSYGGYTGAQTFWFFFQNGKIFRSQNTEESIGGIAPGDHISIDHPVNCNDGQP